MTQPGLLHESDNSGIGLVAHRFWRWILEHQMLRHELEDRLFVHVAVHCVNFQVFVVDTEIRQHCWKIPGDFDRRNVVMQAVIEQDAAQSQRLSTTEHFHNDLGPTQAELVEAGFDKLSLRRSCDPYISRGGRCTAAADSTNASNCKVAAYGAGSSNTR